MGTPRSTWTRLTLLRILCWLRLITPAAPVGNIVGGADLSLNLTGDLTTQGDALLTISNDTGGMIGSDAVINVTAANISTGGALNAAIDQQQRW